MGALASNRKRGGDEYFNSYFKTKSPYPNSSDFHLSKKPRISTMNQSPEMSISSSNNTISRISRYPESKFPLKKGIHAPLGSHKFRVSTTIGDHDSVKSNRMGKIFSRAFNLARREALDSLRYFKKEKQVLLVEDNKRERESVSDEFSVEEVQVIEKPKNNVEREDMNVQPSSSSVVTELNNGSLRVDKALDMLPLDGEVSGVPSVEAYRKLLETVESKTPTLKHLEFEIELNEKKRAALQDLRSEKKEEQEQVIPREPFIPLTKEEEDEVLCAFSASNRRRMLVSHKPSSIDISGEALQCLKPSTWLNDEVINLYIELLKERENRCPQKFLKCHFFNTFFYKKLIGSDGSYSYKAVKRWTTLKKLGYYLIDCDKIFVPIHKDIHWCLAVINNKDQKFQYLDSLKGRDARVLKALAKYFVEELRDKSGENIDINSWEYEFVEDLPGQENGFDCGMFMLKYMDFYSRGLSLCFSQEHMLYFRLRTAKEILRLRAD